MSWAMQRRILYAVGMIIFLLVVVGGPIAYIILKTPPSCTDGIMNQGETSPDLGGPCVNLDPRAQQAPVVMWARSFRVRDGSYNAIAYVQNPNEGAGATNFPYRFRLYDAQNILVADREGTMYLAPGTITPVFEGQIPTGNRTAVRAFFDFTGPPQWVRTTDAGKSLVISNKRDPENPSAPRVSATITNTSTKVAFDVVITATVFDPSGNAIAASETIVPRLAGGEVKDIAFTWPDPFSATVGRVDIVPVISPGSL